MLARGTFGTGYRSGWVVNQCTCANERGAIGTLTIEWEAGGAAAVQPLPIGNFACESQELYPKIERNTFFDGIDPFTVNLAQNAILSHVDANGKPLTPRGWLATQITTTNGYAAGDIPTQLAFASNLLNKLSRGEETFYLCGFRYWYEIFSYTMPTLSRGAVTGTPGGPLAGLLASNTSWLRLADCVETSGVPGSMVKITVTWLGGPVYGGLGYWDPNLYP